MQKGVTQIVYLWPLPGWEQSLVEALEGMGCKITPFFSTLKSSATDAAGMESFNTKHILVI